MQNLCLYDAVWSVFSERLPFGMGSFAELMHIGMSFPPELVPFGMGSG